VSRGVGRCASKYRVSQQWCREKALPGSAHCYNHDPALKEQHRIDGAKRKKNVIPPPKKLTTLEGVRDHMASLIRTVEVDASINRTQKARVLQMALQSLFAIQVAILRRDGKMTGPDPSPTPRAQEAEQDIEDVLGGP